MRSTRREPLWIWLIGVPAAVALVATMYLPVQVTLVMLGTAVGLILHSRVAVIVFAVLLVPTVSLVRRVVAGPTGYTDDDPLILLPLILVVSVVAVSWTRQRSDPIPSYIRGFASATIIGVVATLLLTGSFDIDSIFFGSVIAIPLLLSLALSTGRMSPVWGVISKVIPALAVIVGIYGIIQFFFLPNWDRAWMITSNLASIGHPYPLLVRVFGASESPGPYALFLGLALTLCLCSATIAPGPLPKLKWLGMSVVIVVPLLLSGVRSALLGVLVCTVLLVLIRGRGLARILLLGFLVAAYFLLTTLISRFGGSSTVLTADRYIQFSDQDASLIERLELLQYLRNPLHYVFANPQAPVTDNLFIDVMIRYGLLPAIALLFLFIAIAFVAFRNLIRKQNETGALCALFVVTQSIAGNVFNSLFGIIIGVVFGTIMARQPSGSSSLTLSNHAKVNSVS